MESRSIRKSRRSTPPGPAPLSPDEKAMRRARIDDFCARNRVECIALEEVPDRLPEDIWDPKYLSASFRLRRRR